MAIRSPDPNAGIKWYRPRETQDMLAAITQLMLCLVGGGWAAYRVDPDSSWWALGSVGLAFGWFLAYAAAKWLAGLIAGVFLLGTAVRWIRNTDETPERARQRDARAERAFHLAQTVTVTLVLFTSAIVLAMAVWIIAEQASLPGLLGRFLGVAMLASLLTTRAQRVIDDATFGRPPP